MTQDRDVKEALVVLDVLSTFEHDDGDRLLASMRARLPALTRALYAARRRIAVIYVNDTHGIYDGDAPGLVARAGAAKGGDVARELAPEPGDRFLFKASYSAFEGTLLPRLLEELEVARLVLVGAATEMCVAQTAIYARERGIQVTVLRDACASVDRENERTALAYLENVTGSIVTTVDDWVISGADAA